MCPEHSVGGVTVVGAPKGPGTLVTTQGEDGRWSATFLAQSGGEPVEVASGFSGETDEHMLGILTTVTGHVFGLLS